jgi:hypothetical protein
MATWRQHPHTGAGQPEQKRPDHIREAFFLACAGAATGVKTKLGYSSILLKDALADQEASRRHRRAQDYDHDTPTNTTPAVRRGLIHPDEQEPPMQFVQLKSRRAEA